MGRTGEPCDLSLAMGIEPAAIMHLLDPGKWKRMLAASCAASPSPPVPSRPLPAPHATVLDRIYASQGVDRGPAAARRLDDIDADLRVQR